jgi:hypothetical protein
MSKLFIACDILSVLLVNRIKEETKTAIIIPNDSEKKSLIRIEGSPEGVKKAKAEILEIAKKLENERSRDIIIEYKFHRSIIGPKGEGMQEIRMNYPDVRISFPEAATKSDIVNIRGPKDHVDKVYAQLKKRNSELIASNYRIDVPIYKKFHRNIIGRGGATIKRVIIILVMQCYSMMHYYVRYSFLGYSICVGPPLKSRRKSPV